MICILCIIFILFYYTTMYKNSKKKKLIFIPIILNFLGSLIFIQFFNYDVFILYLNNNIIKDKNIILNQL